MILKFRIDNSQYPKILAAILAAKPKPAEGEPGYDADMTDAQWAHHVLEQRFRQSVRSMLKRAHRDGVTADELDSGIPAGFRRAPTERNERNA